MSACSTGDSAPAEETEATATTAEAAPDVADTDDAAAEPVPATTAATTSTTGQPRVPATTIATTTTVPPPPKPTLELRAVPQIHGNTLAARWLVAPLEANCYHDLLNADSEVIGTGVAGIDLYEDDDGTRFINERYDPATAEAVDSVVIRCSVRGGEETAAQHPVRRPVYQNRHPDSVFPADDEHYFDHEEVRALFPECRPSGRPPDYSNYSADWSPTLIFGEVVDQNGDGYVLLDEFRDVVLVFWPEVYRNWDTASLRYESGFELATGWWTTKQLRMRYPKSTLTADNAPQLLAYSENVGVLTGTVAGTDQDYGISWHISPQIISGIQILGHLYQRLADSVGFVNVPGLGGANPKPGIVEEMAQLIKDTGLSGSKPNPRWVSPGDLLWEWTTHRYHYVPVDREPTAWAMLSLLEARGYECVATSMRQHCESGEFHLSPHMRHPDQEGSRLGSVLWSLICPEIKP